MYFNQSADRNKRYFKSGEYRIAANDMEKRKKKHLIGRMFLSNLQSMVDQVKIFTKEIQEASEREKLES